MVIRNTLRVETEDGEVVVQISTRTNDGVVYAGSETEAEAAERWKDIIARDSTLVVPRALAEVTS